MPNQTPLAEVAYKAYGDTTDHKNFLGHPMPAWDDLPSAVQTAWAMAADAILTATAEPSQVVTRAKFRCNSVEEFSSGQRIYKLTAVADDGTAENERYHLYTPSGQLAISVDNPAVEFKTGASYYLDFTPADADQ